MEHTTDTLDKFCELVAKILYTTAAIDKKIMPAEIEKLRKIVKSKWLQAEKKTPYLKKGFTYQMENTFDDLLAQHWDITQTLPEVTSFMKIHPCLFNEQIVQLIMNSVYTIEMAFAGYNKSELVFANRLENVLKVKN